MRRDYAPETGARELRDTTLGVPASRNDPGDSSLPRARRDARFLFWK